MKTQRIRRSLLCGVLLAGVAGTLTATTRPVRAASITSSPIAATGDGATVKPYFWTELAQLATSYLIGNYVSPEMVVDNNVLAATRAAIGISESALRAIPARALD